MKRLFTLIFVFCFVICISISYCFEKQDTSEFIYDIIQLKQAEINSFDPVDAYHAGHIQIIKQLFNTLADIDLKGNIVPSLATSWDTVDGITWTFHLREDVYFLENNCFANKSERKFNALDVKYTFERLLNKKSNSFGVSYFKNIVGFNKFREIENIGLDGIMVHDEKTVIFKLKKADYNFPNLLTLPYTSIVKRKAVDYYGRDFRLNPVGTGPFILSLFEANKKILLLKNSNYWEKQYGKQLPFIQGVNIFLSTDDNLSFLMFKNKKLNFLELSLSQNYQLKNTKFSFEYKKEILELAQLNFFLFNLERIKDKRIRKGINYAIDRGKIQKIIGEQGKITKSLFPSIFRDVYVPSSMLLYSPEKAKEILKENKSIHLVCFEDMLSRAIAANLSKQLKLYNFNVKIEAVTFPVLVDRLTKGNYDIIQLYWGPLYADVGHFLNPFISESFPPSGNNFNKYSNSDFDRIVAQAPKFKRSKQRKYYLNAQDIILDDMPFILTYFKNYLRISNKKFTMPIHPLGYRFYKYSKKN